MCGTANAITKGLGDVIGTVATGGLNKTNLGGGIFKKVGDATGSALTFAPKGLAKVFGGGSSSPSLAVNPATGTAYDSSGDMGKLESIFSPIRENSYKAIDASTADQLKKLRSDQAARGVLRSGVSDYPSTELSKANAAAKGTVESQLASLLGGTESSRSLLGTQFGLQSTKDATDFNRNLDLTRAIIEANKPSTLSQIFQGVGAFAPLLGAAFGPGGMLAGSAIAGATGGGGGNRLASLFGPTSSANSSLPIGML